VALAGLLVADLLLAPWHRFALDLDLRSLGLSDIGGVEVTQTGVQGPHAALGVAAVVVAVVLAAVVGSGRGWRDRGIAVRGPGVLGLVLARVAGNTEYLAWGAVAAVVLAAVLAWASMAVGRGTLAWRLPRPAGRAAPFRTSGSSR